MQHRGRQLAAPVDAHVEHVLVVELEVDPRAAVRDDAGVVEQLARRVALALVVVEEGARAAVQLADDDALGAVDDEGAVLGHQRDLAEVDLLLLHVADGLRAGLLVLVPDDQADHDLDRRGVGHPALVALVDVVLGLLEVVADELQRAGLVEVLDGEDRLEDALEPDVLALLGRRRRPAGTCRTSCFWMSMRLGMSMIFWIFAKFLRTRKLFWIVGAIELVPLSPEGVSSQALRAGARPAHDFMPGGQAGGRGWAWGVRGY